MAISYARNFFNSRKLKSLLAVAVSLPLLLLTASTAQAETAWRYWSYWTQTDGTWQMSMTGAADVEAVDGSVQGWRYITAGLEIGKEFAPRSEATFTDICGTTQTREGFARVAVVVDFGDPSDYSDDTTPPEVITECVALEVGSPSSLLLPNIVELREENGLICAVNGFPSSGCGEEVELSATDEPTLISEPIQNDSASNIFNNPLVLGGLALFVAILAFFGLKKRN